jgi:hypothetical protein
LRKETRNSIGQFPLGHQFDDLTVWITIRIEQADELCGAHFARGRIKFDKGFAICKSVRMLRIVPPSSIHRQPSSTTTFFPVPIDLLKPFMGGK